jgi:hypothetical protein
MGILRRSGLYSLALCAVVLGLMLGGSTAGAAALGDTCHGTLNNFPAGVGKLGSTYGGNLRIDGACAAINGPTVVNGNLTLLPGSTLLAAFHSGSLTVKGSITVMSGATLILGCIPSSFTCFDSNDASSPGSVGGDLTASGALAVIVHNTTIGGSVNQSGGGGGETCNPPGGIFSVLGFPAYSTYEDSTVAGNISLSGVQSCWMGTARVHLGGSMWVLHNQLADPDAIEIVSNTITGNLVCKDNSMVWDSGETSNDLYPRAWQPNTVGGQRVGQCVTAPPLTKGGTSPGAF